MKINFTTYANLTDGQKQTICESFESYKHMTCDPGHCIAIVTDAVFKIGKGAEKKGANAQAAVAMVLMMKGKTRLAYTEPSDGRWPAKAATKAAEMPTSIPASQALKEGRKVTTTSGLGGIGLGRTLNGTLYISGGNGFFNKDIEGHTWADDDGKGYSRALHRLALHPAYQPA